MIRLNAQAAKKAFGDTLNRVAYGKERIILERRGEDLVALVPLEDLRLLERLTEKYEALLDAEDADRIVAEAKPGDFESWEKVKSDLGL
jgi:prevent-host-death family protein